MSKTRSRPTPLQLERAVNKFNREFPVGSKVLLRKDETEVETTVIEPAMVLGFHSAVAWFEGVSGCYSIVNRVRKPLDGNGRIVK